MQVEQKPVDQVPEDPTAQVIRKFGRKHQCIGCNKWTSFLQETFHNEKREVIVGRYKCKCGYKQGIVVNGPFVDWYRETIKGEDPAKLQLEKSTAKEAAEEAAKLEELQTMPEVKIN